MVMHDVVVIGAGPAGLSAAAELSRAGDCLLLEQGRGQRERDRDSDRDILAGIGGAGPFSDGKHSFYPAASGLWTLSGAELLAGAFDRTAALLARHGVVAAPWRAEAAPAPTPGAWHLKRYPSIYMSLPRRMAAIAELEQACSQRWIGAEVVAAAREGAGIRLGVLRDGVHIDVQARQVVIACGRLAPPSIRRWLTPLGVRYGFRRVEFGVRVESSADSPLFRRLPGTDPKLRFCEADGVSEARTFCVCRDGEVVLGRSLDASAGTTIAAYSGRADGPPSGRSSLGLLVRSHDEALARATLPALLAATPRSLALAEVDAAALVPLFAAQGAAAVMQALARLHGWCPELAGDRQARVYAPCIEGVGDYPGADDSLQAAPGVWLAGDVGGRFRGIVASMVSGRYVAARILQGG